VTSPSSGAGPSSGADNQRPGRANFRLPWEIVVAPARAFDRIPLTPEWLLAIAIVTVLEGVAAYASFPAQAHVLLVLSRTLGTQKLTTGTVWENTVLPCTIAVVKIMLTATALTLFAGTRDVKKMIAYPAYLALAANCGIIAALGDFLVGLADALRNPASFGDIRSLDMAFPVNMTIFADPSSPEQALFLTHFGLFTVWADIVLAFGFAKLANVRLVSALVFVFTLELVFPFILQ
jgi:hypothetical protein